jgi:glycosyltransferase involved in cell wall biosynthesis
MMSTELRVDRSDVIEGGGLPADAVVAAYRLFLNRDPENVDVVDANMGISLRALVQKFLTSEEFQWAIVRPALAADPSFEQLHTYSDEEIRWAQQFGYTGAALDSPVSLRQHFGKLVLADVVKDVIIELDDASINRFVAALTSPSVASLTAFGERQIKGSDVALLYDFLLGRPAEGVPSDAEYAGVTRNEIIAKFITSLEFKLSFLLPFVGAAPMVQPGYDAVPGCAILSWAKQFFALSTPIALRLDEARSMGAAVWTVLTDQSVAELALDSDVEDFVWQIGGPCPVQKTYPEAQQLRLLGLDLKSYPEAFLWRVYSRGRLEIAEKWAALKHLIDHAAEEFTIPPTDQDGRADIYALLAKRFRVENDPYSITMFQLVQSLRPMHQGELQDMADSLSRLKLPQLAMATYMKVAEGDIPNYWTYVNGINAALALGDYSSAFKLLELTKENSSGHPEWRSSLYDSIEAEFAADAQMAKAFYRRDRREEADQVLLAAVQRAAGRLTSFDPLGAPVPVETPTRIVMLANCDIPQCKHYRVDQKLELFSSLGYTVDLFQLDEIGKCIESLPGAAAFLIYRQAAWPSVVRAILSAKAMAIPTIYEIDDLIFDSESYPEPVDTYGGLVDEEEYADLLFGVPLFRAAMSLCDYGLASTSILANQMKAVVAQKKVWVLPNGLDSRNETAFVQTRPTRTDDIIIFYGSGTKAHNSDFNTLAAPALAEILEERPNVRLIIAGHLQLEKEFASVLGRTSQVEYLSNINAYWRLLQTADINLAVLNNGVLNDTKSEIKWLEAAYFGIPSVVSPTATYKEHLSDGVDVLFASSPETWKVALLKLIDSAALRQSVSSAARDKALAAYGFNANAKTLESIFSAVGGSARMAVAKSKPRILLCNVFFPPQTIGGATRVVRNNIDAWIDAGLDKVYDLAIFTTDEGVQPSGRTRLDNYRGLPVFRVSTPAEVNMDWRPFNPQMAEIYGRFHDLWRPDLVHFHCVQRMTASVVDVCRMRGTPYFVTAHDAWWISDYQFLVDDRGEIVDPRPGAPKAKPPKGVTPWESQVRLARLKDLLGHAKGVLAVSDAFAQIYRAAGILNVQATTNGLPPMRKELRTKSKDGRVRLCHVGGMSAHKGYVLLRQALTPCEFNNLVLTVVDHRRTGGDVEYEMWGGTEVRFVGKTSQDEMGLFYSQQDVLLAPSIWPESYGLVTREALACGLWVIASDRGAIGEDVRPGITGFRVGVEGFEPLKAALAEINADPLRYLSSPPVTKLRSAKHQAEELITLYKTALPTGQRTVNMT